MFFVKRYDDKQSLNRLTCAGRNSIIWVPRCLISFLLPSIVRPPSEPVVVGSARLGFCIRDMVVEMRRPLGIIRIHTLA
ncbi:hypothetical protein JMJ77_0004828 [Colletotrichum scovillei]|uniref:Uncharacterized protein n=1 Tax=Colletotrichum scovillei TaxID=1209932 RepID=A0A9P7RJF5_9PEZI|nr:hypothetical protein JMJ77_0004828 [Colletotrichum scovillei]KAG7076066.1 hypothetical protein JMJ76_0013338 [Colletotrichum scovillei]KAG7083153.1 hypothetical protein JMJ78_0008603 [Colletotrichum scovillei]